MTDWGKKTVAELKEELKGRGVSLTGLKLKQHFIDKLVEIDSASQEENGTAEEKTNGAIGEVEEEADHDSSKSENDDSKAEQTAEKDPESKGIKISTIAESEPESEKPQELKEEDSRAQEESMPISKAEDVPVAETAEEATDIQANDVLVPQPEQMEVDDKEERHAQSQAEKSEEKQSFLTNDLSQENAKEEIEALTTDKKPTEIVSSDESTPHVAPYEILEDQRRRKRRSVTPTPSLSEVHKKAKSASGEAIITKTGSPRESSPAETDREKKIQNSNEVQADRPDEPETSTSSKSASELPNVEPSLHPATQSLYIRGFKRPLHIPTLRAHISELAKSPTAEAEQDPVKFFYLDSIRTHAFVTFTSISAASRVRSSMHETRFPNEPQRDPLWIDFVPDDKVQDWAEQESAAGGGGAFGRGGSVKGKFEVIYNKTEDGDIEAILQEGDTATSRPHRSSAGININDHSSLTQRQQSFSADVSRSAAIASGIHPDRAGMVPKSPALDRRAPASRDRDYASNRRTNSPPSDRQRRPQAQSGRDASGKGFAALDHLFSNTSAKPKLYFKLPPQPVIDERLQIIQHLYPDRGFSGDPGMKRYTFEFQDSRSRRDGESRQQWVDGGPEFGHGRKGQDRLLGGGGYAIGRGGGGGGGFIGRGRGRGGGRGRFGGGDSYRGAGVSAESGSGRGFAMR